MVRINGRKVMLSIAVDHILICRFSEVKPQIQMSDEQFEGRPLYFDAQATTPLVSDSGRSN